MKRQVLYFIVLFLVLFFTSSRPIVAVKVSNPILPGYFADPSIVELDGRFYIYATVDPWGEDFLSCWSSDDLVNWEFHKLNWPTKAECTTSLSKENKVWAPSVVKRNNNYYMYVSVGSEIWCGVASHPLGPWRNALIDKPLVPYDISEYYHVIDAEVFIDTDNRCFLYWGSGWNWKNGHCFVAELNDDMSSFKGEKVEVTPENYFEAPFMIKHKSTYFLTYSDGKTLDDTYKVRYAVGSSPFGPFKEAKNSPILYTDALKEVYGPGHHSIYNINNQSYVFYHKHRLPYVEGTAFRQLCMDTIKIDGDSLCKIVCTDELDFPFDGDADYQISNILIETSSARNTSFSSTKMNDGSNQTMWIPSDYDKHPWIKISLPDIMDEFSISILSEYPWKKYKFDCEISLDGVTWHNYYRNEGEEMIGSPFTIPVSGKAKYVRLNVDGNMNIWEIKITKR